MASKPPDLRSNARALRKNMTEAERYLWSNLKRLENRNCRFRRQVVIGNFIVDFVCHQSRIIIELDGGQHSDDAKALDDEYRDKWLNARGYSVLRFWNHDVIQTIHDVIEQIIASVEQR